MSANARMENSGPPKNGESKGRKAAERVVLWIAIPCLLAMGVWRFILPWTGERTDLMFIGISAVGVCCFAWLGFFRK